jgi:hypothetical protein
VSWKSSASAWVAAAVSIAVAACGSSSPTAVGRTDPNQAQAQQDTLSFARCMRSHGIASFPDDLNFQNVPGINPASPGFKSAQTACQHLLPVKSPPPAAPSSATRAKLLRLANCLRTHGYPNMPDPRINPPPQGGSAQANQYSALFGEGDYWIGIPKNVDAHGAGFVRSLHECHANP